MPNNSATGGYLQPATTRGLPGGLTLTQFIQTVLVGVSGIAGALVRPAWQVAPPKQPDIGVDWIAFRIERFKPDTYAYTGPNNDTSSVFLRNEGIEVICSFYGPDAGDVCALVRDGFQIQQNLEALRLANIGFTDTSEAITLPDLVNERWINRVEMSVRLMRQVQRTYPILPILSAAGTVHTVIGDEEYLLDWQTQS